MSNTFINIRFNQYHLLWENGSWFPHIEKNYYWKPEWKKFVVIQFCGYSASDLD